VRGGCCRALPEGLVEQSVRSDLMVYMTPPAINYEEELKKLTKDAAAKIKNRDQLLKKLGMACDYDAKGLKKMGKNEKKLKQACEKFGQPVGELPAMAQALAQLLELQASDPKHSSYVAAMECAKKATTAKVS
jgi:DNA repair ATPase RecN